MRRHDLARGFGLDSARGVLGHSSPATTEFYAELDMAKTAGVMEMVGCIPNRITSPQM
jgi:hypothetical protein